MSTMTCTCNQPRLELARNANFTWELAECSYLGTSAALANLTARHVPGFTCAGTGGHFRPVAIVHVQHFNVLRPIWTAGRRARQKSSELSALPDRYCGAQCTECTSDLAGEEASTDVIPWPANLVFPKAPAGHVARHWASATGELRAPAVRICVAVDTANVRAPADSHRGISSRRRRREAAGSNASGLARRRCEFAWNVSAGTVQIGIA
jgi:hypothetical protein